MSHNSCHFITPCLTETVENTALYTTNSIKSKNFNHPTRGNFVVVMAGS